MISVTVNLFSVYINSAASVVNIKLLEAQVISQSGRKRKEVDEDRGPQAQAVEMLPYLQAAQVLQAPCIS